MRLAYVTYSLYESHKESLTDEKVWKRYMLFLMI